MIEAHLTVGRQPSAQARQAAVHDLASRRVSQARRRAELQLAPGLFNGESALRAVLREDGVWNWALVGPVPEELPLSGGGAKGVEELRSVVEERAHCFGFVRLEFRGAGGRSLTKWVYIHTSEENCVEYDMRRSLLRLTPLSVRVCVDSEGDCVPELFIDALQAAAQSDEERALITWDGYRAAQDAETAVRRPGHELTLASLQVSRLRSGDVHHDMSWSTPVASFQRRRMKLFAQGDRVEVLHEENGCWMDGEVLDVVKESCFRDDMRVRAGSHKVLFSDSMQYRWVLPIHSVRPSLRPRYPSQLSAKVFIETNLVCGTWWVLVHGELYRGCFQWWHSQEDAEKGVRAVGCINLLGLRQEHNGRWIKLQTDGASGGVYGLKPQAKDDLSTWVEALWMHAAFCQEEWQVSLARQASEKERLSLRRSRMNTQEDAWDADHFSKSLPAMAPTMSAKLSFQLF